MIQHPNALQAENLMAYDNAVSSLGKICVFHRDSIDAAQVLACSLSLIISLDSLFSYIKGLCVFHWCVRLPILQNEPYGYNSVK